MRIDHIKKDGRIVLRTLPYITYEIVTLADDEDGEVRLWGEGYCIDGDVHSRFGMPGPQPKPGESAVDLSEAELADLTEKTEAAYARERAAAEAMVERNRRVMAME